MADAALFIGWGAVVHGREERAIEVFNETLQYYSGLQSKREIENFEVVLLEPHGGDLSGFALVRGESAKLERLRRDPEFERHTARAQLIVDNVGVVGATIGAGITRLMTTYSEEIAKVRQPVTA